jgi:hypothetical protein
MPTTFHLGGCESDCEDCKKICGCAVCFDKRQEEICIICKTDSNLITEETRTSERLAGWIGVDFWTVICSDCWELEKTKE